MKRLLVLAAILAASLSATASDARMNAVSKNTASFTADTADAYFHVYSQSTDPGGVTGYATRRGSSPAVLGRHAASTTPRPPTWAAGATRRRPTSTAC